MLGLELALVLVLILLNGFLAMAELSVVSSRKAALQPLAQRGNKGAQVALELAAKPGHFLSAVQVGITLVGILAGAYGGATLSERLVPVLADIPLVASIAESLSVAIVVASITALSVIVGELVPKRIALAGPERIAIVVSRPMRFVAKAAYPIVWVLDNASRLLLRLLGVRTSGERAVTDEEIRALIAEAARTGIVHQAEGEMIDGVMRLADRSVRAVMTPRNEVVWLDLDAPPEDNKRKIVEFGFDRYPVARGRIDNVVGVLDTQELLKSMLLGKSFDIQAAMRAPKVVPDSVGALKAMDQLRASTVHLLVVVDEFGSLEGIVSTSDLTRAVLGTLPGETEDEAEAHQREDGSWLLDGAMSLDEFRDRLQIELPDERNYTTLAGLVLALARRIPQPGDAVEHDGWRLEVIDMDRRRIDKVLAMKIAPAVEG
ncbi:MAG: corC [Alphaproteobacteria bacterium]|nr:corC [Alphaproteobacteria bacterium]